MRLLGLDVGDRRIGVALSDPEGRLASPLTTLERGKSGSEFEAILELIRNREVGCIVVGLPRSLSGQIGPQARKVEKFIEALSRQTSVPVRTWDERFSTAAAERALAAAGRRRKELKKRRDAAAAAIILQDYLDQLRLQEQAREEVSSEKEDRPFLHPDDAANRDCLR